MDRLIEEITVDAYDDDEQLWAFRQAYEDDVALPVDGFVIGEPVSVIAIDYDGNELRGLTVKCSREDGPEYVIVVSEVVLPQTSAGTRYIAAYRRWLNLDPYPVENKKPSRRGRQHKAADDDIDLSKPVELVALSAKKLAARCRLLGSDRITSGLTRIERARGFLEAATLSEDWVKEMGRRALILEVHHTTHIEGTRLTLDQAERLLAGNLVPEADLDDARELLDYRKALDIQRR